MIINHLRTYEQDRTTGKLYVNGDRFGSTVEDIGKDSDSDGVSDLFELLLGLDPLTADATLEDLQKDYTIVVEVLFLSECTLFVPLAILRFLL